MYLKNVKFILVSSALALLGCGSDNKVSSIEDRLEQEKALIKDMCLNPEELDRHLLQQTWFHTEKFQNVAMVFGQYSFSYYKTPGNFEDHIEGAFCIDEKNLKIQYFETKFLPSGIDFNNDSIVSIKFSGNINPLSTDVGTITELSDKILTIKLHSENEIHTFYRRS